MDKLKLLTSSKLDCIKNGRKQTGFKMPIPKFQVVKQSEPPQPLFHVFFKNQQKTTEQYIDILRYINVQPKDVSMDHENSTHLLSYQSLVRAAECLKALAHPNRLQIIQLLLEGEPYTVMEIKQMFGLTQSTTSAHLRFLQRCGLLTSSKFGQSVYYEISEPHLEDIVNCINRRFG